jgi:hypothetical protein
MGRMVWPPTSLPNSVRAATRFIRHIAPIVDASSRMTHITSDSKASIIYYPFFNDGSVCLATESGSERALGSSLSPSLPSYPKFLADDFLYKQDEPG